MNDPFSSSDAPHPAFQNERAGSRVFEDPYAGPPPLPTKEQGPAPRYTPASGAGDTSRAHGLESDVANFEPHPNGLDAPCARRLEETFMVAFRRNLNHVRALGSEVDGSVYDFNVAKEYERNWDERNESKRMVMRGEGHRLPAFPLSPTMQFTVVRKPLFGTPAPKVSLSGSVWSPMDALAAGPVPYGDKPADMAVVEQTLRQLLVHERDETFFYVAICSTTGWDEDLFQMPPDGLNYGVALIEPRFPGWAVACPENWTLALQAALQPDSIDDMRKRVIRTLVNHEDLQVEGGLILLTEVAEATGVPEEVALEELEEYCKDADDLSLEFVEGSHIVRRLRV